MEVLHKQYEDNRLFFTHNYEELHQTDSIKDSVEDLDRVQDRIIAFIRGIQASNGHSASQFVVAAVEKVLSLGLFRQ